MGDTERRCVWCGLPQVGVFETDSTCVCDSPCFKIMEQCDDCGAWEPVDDIHTEDRDGREVAVCSRRRCAG